MKKELINTGGVKKWVIDPIKPTTDTANIYWDLSYAKNIRVTTTSAVGIQRTLSNPTNGVDGKKYLLVYVQNANGNRNLIFDTNFIISRGFINLTPNSTTIIELTFTGGKYIADMFPDSVTATDSFIPITAANSAMYFNSTKGKNYIFNSGWKQTNEPPIQNTSTPYATEDAMYADQANQLEGYGYLVTGVGAFTYLGTLAGTAADYGGAGASLLKKTKTYTGGAQTITADFDIVQVSSLVVGNSFLQEGTQFTVSGAVVTITDTLTSGAVIQLKYWKANAVNATNYTKAESDSQFAKSIEISQAGWQLLKDNGNLENAFYFTT